MRSKRALAWTPEKRAAHGRVLAMIKYRRGPRLPEGLSEDDIKTYKHLTRSCRMTRREAVLMMLGDRGQMA